MAKSVEPAVVRHYTNVLKGMGLKVYEQQMTINSTIENALNAEVSKSGGAGNNRPDIKLLLENSHARRIPVMIEAKGLKNKLEKPGKTPGTVELVTIYEKDGAISKKTGQPTHLAGDENWSAVTDFATNGAIHYANAIIKHSEYKEIIAIGINGYDEKDGEAKNLECKAYYISEKNSRVPKQITGITSDNWDLLKPCNIDVLFSELDKLNLTTEEYERLISEAEADLDARIHRIHQKIYDDKAITLGVSDKMYLFCGLIMAGLPAKDLDELEVSDLKSSPNEMKSDGHQIITQIEAYLDCRKCPDDKKKLILQTLSPVFMNSIMWRPINGESILKQLYKQVKIEIIPCVTGNLHLDFMGRIFNKLGDWITLMPGGSNDVVLTPRYVTQLMARICRVNMNSFVWDRTMGSAGFLVTAMDLMIKDAQDKIQDKEKLEAKINNIKQQQLFGVEILKEVFILAVLNMILMGDGSSNMKNGDGHDTELGKDFPANVFLLNPPYSAPGNGLIFVEEALSMMTSGYAAVLIQESSGSGQGNPYARNILKNNTLVASIRMDPKLFNGKASVHTSIYLFEINKPHEPDRLVKFIDFTNDGYARQARKKSNLDVNLKNVDDALGRYAEVESIILGKRKETDYYNKENGLYVEDVITLDGNDWNYSQHKKIDFTLTDADFQKTVADYLIWQIEIAIKGGTNENG